MSKSLSKNNNGTAVRKLGLPLRATPSLGGGGWRSLLEGPGLFLLVTLILLIVLIVWASVANVDQVVRVEGKIIPAGRSQEIQHLEGGIIASIATTEGAAVKRGDLLLTIDDTAAGSNLSETKVKLDALKLRAARLDAEAKNKSTLDFSPELAALPEANAERSLFISQRAKLDQEISVHENLLKQHSADIDEADQRHLRLMNELTTAHQRSEMVEAMAAHQAASKMEMLDAESREQRLKTEIGEVEGLIPKLKAAISEEQSRIEAARAEFRTTAQNELVLAMDESDRLQQISTAAADRLKRTEIRAPIDGTINRISINTVGGVVKPGETLVELIPNTTAVLIEARAHPRDRGNLRPGLNAEIRVSAYDAGEYGLLKGKVTEVSADSIPDGQHDPYYQVNILVSDIPARYADRVMVPGMTVTADIVTGQRTVLGYLLSPLRKFSYNMLRDPR